MSTSTHSDDSSAAGTPETGAFKQDAAAALTHYRLLVENSADTVFVLIEGVLTWISPAVRQLTGWAPEELIGSRSVGLWHPDDRSKAVTLRDRAAGEGGSGRLTLRLLTKDGGYVWVDVYAKGYVDAEGRRGICGSLMNATERVEAETTLRATMDAMLDPQVRLSAVRDEAGTIVDFVFADANQAACDFNGLPYDQLVGVHLLGQHPAAASTELFGYYVRVVETGEPLVLDDWLYPQDMLGGEERRYDVRAAKLGDGLVQAWRDVTDRHATAEALRDTLTTLRIAQETADLGVWSWEFADNRLAWDDVLCRWYEVPDEARAAGLYYDYWRSKVHPEDVAETEQLLNESIERRAPYEGDFRIVEAGGRIRYIHSAATVEYDGRGNALRMVDINQDTTVYRELEQQLCAANRELEAIARVDVLTGVANRLAALDHLHEEFARMRRTRSPYAVLLLDLDHFKRINDTFGHAAGDQALQRVAGVIRRALRETDHLARFGGEEFVVILPDTGPAGAMKVAENIRRTVEADELPGDGHLTVSIGVSVARAEDPDEMAVVARADSCMYQGKATGRNRVVNCEGQGGDGGL